MPVLRCYVDDETMAKLEYFSRQDGRSVEELAEAAISDNASRVTLPTAHLIEGAGLFKDSTYLPSDPL